MGASGMAVTFVNPTTMIFGSSEAVKAALDARDGLNPSLLDNSAIMESMQAVDSESVWSVLDQEGTQYMMHSVLGQASQVTDYDTVKKRLLGSRYTMDFSNGVKFQPGRAHSRRLHCRHHGFPAQRRRALQKDERHADGKTSHREHDGHVQRGQPRSNLLRLG